MSRDLLIKEEISAYLRCDIHVRDHSGSFSISDADGDESAAGGRGARAADADYAWWSELPFCRTPGKPHHGLQGAGDGVQERRLVFARDYHIQVRLNLEPLPHKLRGAGTLSKNCNRRDGSLRKDSNGKDLSKGRLHQLFAVID